MNFVFPYYAVERGSKVAIYGFGCVGKEFIEQMMVFPYCELVLCVDQSFESFEKVNRPFGKINDLLSEEYDYVIVAIQNGDVAKEIISHLTEKGGVEPSKIVWSPDYSYRTKAIWPRNKKQLLENPEFYGNIIRKYRESGTPFGFGQFYQSFSKIGIQGTRNTQERLDIYNVRKYLKPSDEVLDIGCNCGFFDLQLSEYVQTVYGIDSELLLIEIANETKQYIGNHNVTFACKKFDTEMKEDHKTYDAVFSLAVHMWILDGSVSKLEFVNGITGKLKPQGILFFESQAINEDRERFDELCKMFVDNGMEIVMRENYFSDFERDIVVMRKL